MMYKIANKKKISFRMPANQHTPALEQWDRIGEVVFSRGTYQVEVLAKGKKSSWTFLQFDETGKLRDYLCSCDEEHCSHLAIAYKAVSYPRLIHLEFSDSLWNTLGKLWADAYGYDADVLKKVGDGHYTIDSQRFSLQIFTPQKCREWIDERLKESESNSLKFSNLPQEEIDHWRQGRASQALYYELSFWADIAKYMAVQQHFQKPYRVEFLYAEDHSIKGLKVTFNDLSWQCELSTEQLAEVIAKLNMVESPLPVYDYGEDAIEDIYYHKDEGTFTIKELSQPHPSKDEEIFFEVGCWLFIPGKGFFSKEHHPLWGRNKVENDEVEAVLEEYWHLVSRKIVNTVVHHERVDLHYELNFDEHWTLHIAPYLFNPGDLQCRGTRLFGQWAYLEDLGFYRLKRGEFPPQMMSIAPKDINDFVTVHQSWLNTQRGYRIRYVNLGENLAYKIEEGALYFYSYVDLGDIGDEGVDFGEWVYLEGKGFYSKGRSIAGVNIRPGLKVSKEKVAEFIDKNYGECLNIPGFFLAECPVLKSGLKVEYEDPDRIKVAPDYKFSIPGKVRFYGDYVYLEGEGFYHLPQHLRLPEEFQESQVIAGEEVFSFLKYKLPSLESFVTYLDYRLRKPHEWALKVVEADFDSQQAVWQLNLEYSSEYGKVGVDDLLRAQHKGRQYLVSEAGLVNLKDQRWQWMKRLLKGYSGEGSLLLTSAEFLKLYAFEEPSAGDRLGWFEALGAFLTLKNYSLKGFKSSLRDYQTKGLEWLWALYQYRLGGLLCDDMGLGKTHQAMSLMAAINNSSRKRQKFLVVCPTSVIWHWHDKLTHFYPSLKVIVYHGTGRDLEAFDNDGHVLITSYGIYRRDQELLDKYPWKLAILDEIQVAKNPYSRIHHALASLPATMRLGLTGTPIENNLQELKALFDLVLPGYMPSEKVYKELFVVPIEKQGDREQAALLRRIVRPLLMRRTKEAVLTDLPSKTESIEFCELAPEQDRLYHKLLLQSRDKLLHDLSDSSKDVPYLHIFALLSNLKQICNHPAVYLNDPQNYQRYPSGKWELFKELLQQARDSRQKVVIFSQYLAMLDIIEKYLCDHGVGYAAVRGATTDRQRQLSKFHGNPNCEVFVGSLQAVGLGVDLTAASVVIHYDRWWSAAREEQATDRVHRLGQQQGVQVFKLITKGTFEERIHQLIINKKQLMEKIVDAHDQNDLKRFSRRDLARLLEVVE
ncbi:MAG: DEAD/DEAH box helicase [Chlamydiota bacterium]